MRVYYNENNAYCAAWLRNLMRAGEIPRGDVDERDIRDVLPSDVAGYDQCHWFAGLGGWPYALRLAGWDRPCWTGSCPCQPFSSAGKGLGFADERHLWPAFHWLIEQCRPSTIFGEQVARAGDWLALVRSDLEALEYAVGCMPIEAASIGANHLRDRVWFVADTGSKRRQQNARSASSNENANGGARRDVFESNKDNFAASGCESRPVADANGEPLGRSAEPWAQYRHWLVEPGMGRVADGVAARVDKLRALGNAIVPQCGAAFVSAYMAWLDVQ